MGALVAFNTVAVVVQTPPPTKPVSASQGVAPEMAGPPQLIRISRARGSTVRTPLVEPA